MEQRQDDGDPSASGSGDERDGSVGEADGRTLIERHFLLLLAAALGLAGVAGVGVTYAEYSRVGETIQSIPYVGQVAENPGTVPYADQIMGLLPFGGEASDDGKKAPGEYGSFTRLDGLVVNPAKSGGNRYLAVSIAFEAGEVSVETELKNKKVVVKDAVLRLLSERTVDELSDPGQRDDLKAALIKETNRILTKGTVDRLYFTEFVLQ